MPVLDYGKNYAEDNNTFLRAPKPTDFHKFEPPLNLAVMASGAGTNFEAIVDSCTKKYLNAIVSILIVNNPDCGAIRIAERFRIEYKLINHRDYNNREQLDNKILEVLNNKNIDGIILAGWMRILSDKFIHLYKGHILNIHPSLLPSFPGINAIKNALKAKVKITGCTVHYVTQQLDSGPIIAQASVPVLTTDTETTLRERIQKQEHIILPMAIDIAGKKWRSS